MPGMLGKMSAHSARAIALIILARQVLHRFVGDDDMGESTLAGRPVAQPRGRGLSRQNMGDSSGKIAHGLKPLPAA